MTILSLGTTAQLIWIFQPLLNVKIDLQTPLPQSSEFKNISWAPDHNKPGDAQRFAWKTYINYEGKKRSFQSFSVTNPESEEKREKELEAAAHLDEQNILIFGE